MGLVWAILPSYNQWRFLCKELRFILWIFECLLCIISYDRCTKWRAWQEYKTLIRQSEIDDSGKLAWWTCMWNELKECDNKVVCIWDARGLDKDNCRRVEEEPSEFWWLCRRDGREKVRGPDFKPDSLKEWYSLVTMVIAKEKPV